MCSVDGSINVTHKDRQNKNVITVNKRTAISDIVKWFAVEGTVAVVWDTNKTYPLRMLTYNADEKDDNGYNWSEGAFGNLLIGFRHGGYRNIYLIDKATLLCAMHSKKPENQYIQIRRKAHTKIVWQVVK